MSEIKILNEKELRRCIRLDLDTINCIETAFALLATEKVIMPPILSFHIPEHNGEVDVKTAYVPGIDSFAIKMSPGFFDNPKLGLPSLNGLMVLFSAKTGLVEALLLDNGYLTDIRTAAAGAVAAKWLSPHNARSAGIIGSGVQARLQLQALCLVRKIDHAFIWGRDRNSVAKCADACRNELGIDVQPITSIPDLMAKSDIVVTTTPAREPLLKAVELKAGQHITAMGADADYKNELAPDLLVKADHYICDSLLQCRKQGELRAAIAAGLVQQSAPFPELGHIIAGLSRGRENENETTICDLTGMGVQDTAIATLAFKRAMTSKIGATFNS